MDPIEHAAALPDGTWRLYPHLYAEEMSKDQYGVPRWKAWDYLHVIGSEIGDAVLRGGGRIIVEAPVRHGKSELISHWTPAWFLDLMPDKHVALTTYESDFARHWGRVVRNEMNENRGIGVQISEDSSAADRWNTKVGGGMFTAGVGGPLTGRGFHLGIVDDPVKNWEQATSWTLREKTKNWFQSTFLTRAEPGATIVVLMARWHEDDLAGWLQREYPNDWKVISIPAIAEANDVLGRRPGVALCPDRYSRRQLLGDDGNGGIKKAVGPIIWNALYRQRPSSLEGGVIKRDFFKFWTELPIEAETGKYARGMTFAMSIDCAFEKTEGSSFVVIQVWARLKADAYLVDQTRERLDFVGTCDAIEEMANRWPQARLKLIEAKANGPAVVSRLKSRIAGLVKYMPRGSKIARLASVSPNFASHNVYVPAPQVCPWVRDYIEELVNMPNSPNDDQADATSQILDYWFKRAPTAGPGGSSRRSPTAGAEEI